MNVNNLRMLREEPAFRTLLIAGFTSGIGDWFNQVAVLSVLLRLTGSGLAVGISLAVSIFPRLLFGPLGGVLADKLPRKAVLVVTDLVSAGTALSFLLITRAGQIWMLYLGTFALVLMSLAHRPARAASIPTLVRPHNLLAANALDSASSGAVMIAGSVLGGIAVSALGSPFAFILNTVSFLLAALLVLSIRIPTVQSQEELETTSQPRRGLLATFALFWEVRSLVRGSAILRAILAMAVLWPLGGGVVNVLMSVYSVQVFHTGSAGIGLLYGAVGVGLVFGGLATPRFRRHVREAVILGFLLEGICHIVVSRAPSLVFATVALALGTAGAGIGNACTAFLMMRAVPNAFLGRFHALLGMLSSVTFGVSVLVTGLLLDVASPRLLGALAGVLIVTSSLIYAAPLLRAALPPEQADAAANLATVNAEPEAVPAE